MRPPTSQKWFLGVVLTIVTATIRTLPAAAADAHPADSAVAPNHAAAEAVGASTNAVPAEPSLTADTDAPAKLVPGEKLVPVKIRPTSPVAEVVKLANSGVN